MLVWINGPFGVGKTQVAHELARRVRGGFVSDPELIGFALHRMRPKHLRHDFQGLSLWRRAVRETLGAVRREHRGPVIVPMTLVEPAYFTEIIGGLRADGHDVRHFALLADRGTVLRRLRTRSLAPGPGPSWAVGQVDRCLDALRRPEFGEHVHTDGRTVPDIADEIARAAGLPIAPATGGRARHFLRRQLVSLRHIR